MKIQEKKGNDEQIQNINKDKLTTNLNESTINATEDLQTSANGLGKQSIDTIDSTQKTKNPDYEELDTQDKSDLQPNGLVKGKAKTKLPDYAPSVEYLKAKMRGEDGKFRMLPSEDIELWIKAVYNSGEIDENKWELIKLLNKMHIFSLADEYEKENKLKEEQEKNWLAPKVENDITQGFGNLKVVERENEKKEQFKNYEPQTMQFGNGTIKIGDTVIKDQLASSKERNSQSKSVSDNNPIENKEIIEKKDGSIESGVYNNQTKVKETSKTEDYTYWDNYVQEIYNHTNVDDGMSVRERIEMMSRNFPDNLISDVLSKSGKEATAENISKAKKEMQEQVVFDSRGSDGMVFTASAGIANKGKVSVGTGGGFIYSPMLKKTYPLVQSGTSGLGSLLNGQVLSMKIITLDRDINLRDANVMHDILSGISIGVTASYGVGGGAMIIGNKKYSGKVIIMLIGAGTPTIEFSASISELLEEHAQRKLENTLTRDVYGLPD